MTDISIVYVLLGVAGVLLCISIFCLYASGGQVNALTVAGMLIPAVVCFKVSNLYIDGTLTTVNRFLASDNTIMTMTEKVQDVAASQIFQLIAIVLMIGTLLQVWQYLHDSKTISELEQGDGDEE